MKVKYTAQVLSNTMVENIDSVIGGQFKLQTILLPQQATALYKIRELHDTFDRWFDRCNSKDRNESKSWKVKVHPENVVQIAGEYLSDLQWIESWRNSLIDASGKFHDQNFLTDETH